MSAVKNRESSGRFRAASERMLVASVAPLAVAVGACSSGTGASDSAEDYAAPSPRMLGASNTAPEVLSAPRLGAAFVRKAPSPAVARTSAPFRAHARPEAEPVSALPPCTPFSPTTTANGASCSDQTRRTLDPIHRGHYRIAGRELLYVSGQGVQVQDAAPGLSAPLLVTHADIPSDAVASTANGTVTYTSASTGSWTSFASTDDGFEDLTYFPTAPAAESLTLAITVPAGAGLRLVGNELSVVSADGTPRVRAAPPDIIGADGTTAPASFTVVDCAFDQSGAAPWGRPIVLPGQSVCHVRLDWEGSTVGYPLIVDPSWTYAASLATARWAHTATLLSSGNVLVTGGQGPSSVLSSCELYNPTTNTWAATGSMSHARADQSATLVTSSTEVLVAGGDDGTVTQNSAEVYSVSAGTWSSAGTMSTTRDYAQAFALDSSHVLLAGGVTFAATGPITTLASAEIYTRTTNTWTTVGSLNQPRAFGMGILAGLFAAPLVAGGDNGTAGLLTFEVYNSTTKAWTSTTGMSHVHENAAAVAYGSANSLFVAGGVDFTGAPLATVEEFNFGLSAWSNALTLGTARGIVAIAAKGGSNYLIGGGASATMSLTSTETFNPVSNLIGVGPSMQVARWGHTATTLNTGNILVVGGLNAATSSPLASAELL